MTPQEPTEDFNEPNMNNDFGSEMPPMDKPSGSEFDTNFDAGVEADEDEDPKKYIQQLTGKLSQELGKYNNELGEPDVELSKYVGGMIVKQVAKNLDEPGKKELIKKINTTNSEADDNDIDNEDSEPEMNDETVKECYSISGRELKEMLGDFNQKLDKIDDETSTEKKMSKISGEKKRTPFSPKKFNETK